jgi:hypothetical protein
MLNKKIADGQVIKVSLQKSPNGITRRIYDGFLMHIEAGVNDRRNPAEPIIFLEDTMEAGIGGFCNQLGASRAVHMNCRRTCPLHKIRTVKG